MPGQESSYPTDQPAPPQYNQYGQAIQSTPYDPSQSIPPSGEQYFDSNGDPYAMQSPNQRMSGIQQYPKQANRKVDRIDPKQIPRPIEFKGGNITRFHTRSLTSPPSAASDYTVIDEGNASCRFIRLTTNNIAHESELIDSTKLCIGAIIQPLANIGDGEENIPVVSYPTGPVRCSRCMAYINPFFQFIEQGNQFICNICNMKNEGNKKTTTNFKVSVLFISIY
jgi:protein transport protein SEC24